MNTFSKRIEEILPRFERTLENLDSGYTGYLVSTDPENEDHKQQVIGFRHSIIGLLEAARPTKENVMTFRDSADSLKKSNLSKELNRASERQAKALDGVVSNMEQVESVGLRIQFLIEEKFGDNASDADQDS